MLLERWFTGLGNDAYTWYASTYFEQRYLSNNVYRPFGF